MEDIYIKMNEQLWQAWKNREKQWSIGPVSTGEGIL